MLSERQYKEALEYESRLFDGGAYSASNLRFASKDAPIREILRVARIRYNVLRKIAGLYPILDWNIKPKLRIGNKNEIKISY
jgi:hypothetical protein